MPPLLFATRPTAMTDWSLDQARKTYSIPHWADGYFDVDQAGRMVGRPTGADGPVVSLPKVVDAVRAAGAVLALSRPGGLIVCNGYKDREYIRLALTGRKLGLQTFIVIEKPSELKLVLEESKALDVKPGLGVRMRLASLGAGKWQNSGGDKAKFGLSPRQLLDLWKSLRDTEYADCLSLLHFHMGSQISNVRDIANGMREATRYFVELSQLGAKITHVDVGGGLGVDYEGTRSRSFCSINYGLNSYASNIVQPLANACEEHGLTPPRIVTECGRAMTAHHAVLIANVSEVEQAQEGRVPDQHDDEPASIRHLREIHEELDVRPAVELFQEAQHF